MKQKLLTLVRNPAVRKIIITLVVSALASAGIALNPAVADDLLTTAAVVGELL